MKILVVRDADKREGARQAEDGEPCVPNFGICGKNLFLGLKTGGLSSIATPGDVRPKELDELFEKFSETYSGIPREMLEKYAFASAEAAAKGKPGSKIRVFHDADNSGCRFTYAEGGAVSASRLE